MAAQSQRALALLLLSGSASVISSQRGVGSLCADYDSCFDCAEHVTSSDYVQFKYSACGDQLNIVPDHVVCNPFSTDNFTYPNETLAAGEYRHYHWTLTTYSLINHEAGASITFEVVPEYGYPQMFTKAQILYGGLPMCQMFETKPGTNGEHSDTWPFPDKNTGAQAQGPEVEIAELEASNLPTSQTYQYPGDVFSEVTWGFNASGYDSDKRPKVHTVTIPHVSYGGYFVSVYAGDNKPARFSISVNAVRTIDIEEDITHYADAETPDGVKSAATEWWASDHCNVLTMEECEKHCCTWDDGTDDSSRRRLNEVGKPAFQRRLQGEDADVTGQCVQASADIICVSEKESNDDQDETPEPTILVSFQTEAGVGKKYKLYFVEMNDCASQMDRNGQHFCWQGGWYTDGGRLDDFGGGKYLEPEWQATCGTGTGETDEEGNYICDPSYSEPGYCNFDGTLDETTGLPKETMWSNAYDCIVWTPNGLSTHGMPVAYVRYQDEDGAWSDLGDNFNGDVDSLYGNYNSSLRLKGIATSYGKSVNAANDNRPTYSDWLTLPASTWITTEIPIYNNVSYFFNVLVQHSNGNMECYKGTSARTYFWRQTTLIPVEMIEIIAVVVVLALLALLVPFILTKRKITAHLRDVYESHKYKGYLKGVEERVIEEHSRRQGLQGDDDDAAKKSEEEHSDKKHHKKHHKKKKHVQIVPNDKPRVPKHAAASKESKDEQEGATAQLSDNHSTSL